MRLWLFILFLLIVILFSGCVGEKPISEIDTTSILTTTIVSSETTTTVETNLLILHFKDDLTDCNLAGKIIFNNISMGETTDGLFNFYLKDFLKYQNSDSNIICLTGKLSECYGKNKGWLFYRCWNVPLWNSTDFYGEELVTHDKIDTTLPNNIYEYQNFVTPNDVKSYIEGMPNKLKNDTKSDLDYIWRSFDAQFSYQNDYEAVKWKLPKEVLDTKKGVCKEFSATLVSLFRAYNESVYCYCVDTTEHLTTFCIIPEETRTFYRFYDMQGTKVEVMTASWSSTSQKYSQIYELLKQYFEVYGTYTKNMKILGVFNEKELKKFGNNDEFIYWVIENK